MNILVILFLLFSPTNEDDRTVQCFSDTKRVNRIVFICQSNPRFTLIPQDLGPNVQELHFKDQQLTNLNKNNFINYYNLIVIYLQGNQIKTVNQGCFKYLTKLKIMDASKNKIRELPDIFQDTPNIEEIYLYDNQITTIKDNVFSNLPQLKKIDLHNNQIREMQPHSIFKLPAIAHINLNTNTLEHISESILDNLNNNLIVFDLGQNKWKCDIYSRRSRQLFLEKFRKIFMPHCYTPENDRGKTWSEIENETMHKRNDVVEVQVGKDVNVTCEYWACILNSSNLICKTKQDQVLQNHKTMKCLGNKIIATLKLNNVTKSDEMKYACTVEDCSDFIKKEVDSRTSTTVTDTKISNWMLIGVLLLGVFIGGIVYHMYRKSDSVQDVPDNDDEECADSHKNTEP